jgi:hypothetical protein
MPMANRRTVGLLKTIRNVAFAHRSQHVQFGRFDTEEDVMRYMIDPFPWLLMMVFQLDQEHKISGSVVSTASDKGTDTAASTDDDAKVGYSTDGASKPAGPKGGRGTATSGDESAGDKITKAKVPAKGKPTKKPNKKAEDQKTKTIQMLKEQMKAMAKTHQMEIATLTKTNPSTRLETKAQPKPDPEPEPELAKPEEPGRDQRQPEPSSTLEPDEPTTQP